MKVYLDMDGVLVDFVKQVNDYDFFRKDKPEKVDWTKVKAVGPKFWSEMNWMPGAEKAFAELKLLSEQGLFDLEILSSIDFEEGITGKKDWLVQKTDFPLEKAIFVLEPEDKANYAAQDTVLIDDREKSLIPFQNAGGNVIKFDNWSDALINLKKFLKLQ